MQRAIQTKYFPPTRTLPARMRAYGLDRKPVVMNYVHGLATEENHVLCAHRFAQEYGLTGVLVGGVLPNNTYCFIFQLEFNNHA